MGLFYTILIEKTNTNYCHDISNVTTIYTLKNLFMLLNKLFTNSFSNNNLELKSNFVTFT